MLLSDMAGLIGSMALVWAPARDQLLRWHEFRTSRDRAVAFWPAARDMLAESLAGKRQGFNGWDSLSVLAGGFLLVAAFALKAVNL